MDRYEDFDPLAPLPFKFRDNLRNAADSAERNFPEGFGRFAPADFARFLDNSRASLLETHNGLATGLDRGYFSKKDVDEALVLLKRALGAPRTRTNEPE